MTALPDKIYCASVPHSTAREQAQIAMRAGKAERDIFIEGNGAENFQACINAIRGPGTIGLVGGAYVLGQGRRAIMEKMRIMRERKITPYNLKTGTFDTAELLSEAIGKINAFRANGTDRQRPKRIGRRGGQMKGIRAQEYRDSVMAEDAVKRLWACPYVLGREVVEILGSPFSESTLRRLYGPKPKLIGKR